MPDQKNLLAVVDHQRLLVLKNNEPWFYEPYSDFLKGDLYGCRVTEVRPALGGAFVDFGGDHHGFLPTDQALSQGDYIVLMVDRPPFGNKGVRFTERVVVAGSYLLYTPNRKYFAYSKKTGPCRSLEEVFPKGYFGVLRTAGKTAPLEVLKKEALRLISEYEAMPFCKVGLLKKISPLEKAIRDYDMVLTSASYEEAQSVMNLLQKFPHVRYEADVFLPFSHHFKQVQKKHVLLSSGGLLTIEQTEVALTVDVNTAKCVRSDAKERTNQEALTEIIRQLVLRCVFGRVLLDFVGEAPPKAEQILAKRLVRLKKISKTASGLLELLME